jgi:hypothetical protein
LAGGPGTYMPWSAPSASSTCGESFWPAVHSSSCPLSRPPAGPGRSRCGVRRRPSRRSAVGSAAPPAAGAERPRWRRGCPGTCQSAADARPVGNLSGHARPPPRGLVRVVGRIPVHVPDARAVRGCASAAYINSGAWAPLPAPGRTIATRSITAGRQGCGRLEYALALPTRASRTSVPDRHESPDVPQAT